MAKNGFYLNQEAEKFTQAKYSKILVTLYNEIKAIINDLDISKLIISLQKKLTVKFRQIKNSN
jgi:hypothetical protein